MNRTINKEVREAIEKNRVYYYEIADKIGVSLTTLTKWMHKELSEVQKNAIHEAIKDIVKDR